MTASCVMKLRPPRRVSRRLRKHWPERARGGLWLPCLPLSYPWRPNGLFYKRVTMTLPERHFAGGRIGERNEFLAPCTIQRRLRRSKRETDPQYRARRRMLMAHPVYTSIRSVDELRIFMQHHAFAVRRFRALTFHGSRLAIRTRAGSSTKSL